MEQTYSRTASYANRVSVVIIKGHKEGRRFQLGAVSALRVVLGILASVYPTNVVIISRNVARQGLRLNIRNQISTALSHEITTQHSGLIWSRASFNKNVNPRKLPVFA